MILKRCLLIIFIFSISISGNSLKDSKNIKTDSIKTVGFDFKNNPYFSKGFDLNFIPKNPSKGRVSEFVLSEVQISELKDKVKRYKPSDLLNNEIVIVKTSKGDIKIKLFNDKAPKHCLNFKKLCNSGFYDYTSFHNVVKDFLIQGGDILSRDGNRENDGTGSPGWTINAEINNISHKRGIVSMVRSPQDLNSAGSQFFICIKDSPFLDGEYTAFGQVIEGMEIVDLISGVPTDRSLMLKLASDQKQDNMIEILDRESRKKLYFKIPAGLTESDYTRQIKKALRSNNPYRRIEISKARVYAYDKNE